MTNFRIRRSTRARRARLTVTDDGEAVAVLPVQMPERAAFEMVARHSAWIDRQVRRMSERRRVLAARPSLEEGRYLPLEGIAHQVVVRRAPDGRTRSRVQLDGELTVLVEMAAPDTRAPEHVLEAWLRSRARLRIGDHVARRAAEMGLPLPPVAIRDQRTRWGSASRRGGLSFSWRLILCPPEVLDYVVVHELAHLRWAGHGVRFWSLVRRHAPTADHHRRWLRQNESALRHALD